MLLIWWQFLFSQKVLPGNIIVRQRGTRFHPGNYVGMGKDHTLFCLKEGNVRFERNKLSGRKWVHVDPVAGHDLHPIYADGVATLMASSEKQHAANLQFRSPQLHHTHPPLGKHQMSITKPSRHLTPTWQNYKGVPTHSSRMDATPWEPTVAQPSAQIARFQTTPISDTALRLGLKSCNHCFMESTILSSPINFL